MPSRGMTGDTGRDDVPVSTRSDDDDDAALSWGPASADSSYVESPFDDAKAPAVVPDDDEDDELPDGVMSSTMLVAHGVFGALFLLATIAWAKSIGNVAPSFDSSLASAMWKIGTWLAVAGPAIWFVGTILLVPTRSGHRRIVSFVVGVVILLPWPFLIGALS